MCGRRRVQFENGSGGSSCASVNLRRGHDTEAIGEVLIMLLPCGVDAPW